MKRIAANGALVVVSLALTLAIGECGVRLLYPHLANYDLEMCRYFGELKQLLPNPRLPFVHYPSRRGMFYGVEIRTNSMGFRDREFAIDKPPGKKRIVMLGDSLVLGWGVASDDTIPKALEKCLNKDGDRCEVINMGVGNYNSIMEVEQFKERGLSLKPDEVVLVYFVNDAEPTPRISRLGYAIKKRSYLAAFFFERYVRLRTSFDKGFNWKDYYASLYAEGSPALAANRDAVRELAGICRERGIHLTIVSYPELHQLKDYPLPMATQHIQRLAAECQAPFLDLLPQFAPYAAESLWVSAEDTHGNSTACRLAAEAICAALQ